MYKLQCSSMQLEKWLEWGTTFHSSFFQFLSVDMLYIVTYLLLSKNELSKTRQLLKMVILKKQIELNLMLALVNNSNSLFDKLPSICQLITIIQTRRSLMISQVISRMIFLFFLFFLGPVFYRKFTFSDWIISFMCWILRKIQ